MPEFLLDPIINRIATTAIQVGMIAYIIAIFRYVYGRR